MGLLFGSPSSDNVPDGDGTQPNPNQAEINRLEAERARLEEEYRLKNNEREDLETRRLQPLRLQRDELTRTIDELEIQVRRLNEDEIRPRSDRISQLNQEIDRLRRR